MIIYKIPKMTIQDQHTERLIRLLRKDADRRKYIKEERGKGQKQYYTHDDILMRQRASHKLKTVVNDIRFLFKE